MTYRKSFRVADINFPNVKTTRQTTLSKIHKQFAANEGRGTKVITDRSEFSPF